MMPLMPTLERTCSLGYLDGPCGGSLSIDWRQFSDALAGVGWPPAGAIGMMATIGCELCGHEYRLMRMRLHWAVPSRSMRPSAGDGGILHHTWWGVSVSWWGQTLTVRPERSRRPVRLAGWPW